MLQVISANRLTDGTVVYLGQQDTWVERLEAAAIFTNEAEFEAGLAKGRAAVAANLIIDPLAVAVVDDGGTRRAVSLRDAIRASGPTVACGMAGRR